MSKKTLSVKVDELILSGMTGKVIANAAGCDASTISRIRSGFISNPAYSVGIAIDRLHKELRQNDKTAA